MCQAVREINEMLDSIPVYQEKLRLATEEIAQNKREIAQNEKDIAQRDKAIAWRDEMIAQLLQTMREHGIQWKTGHLFQGS